MLIKKATFKKVKVWQNLRLTDDVYGCDCCKKEIKQFPNESNRLELTVWEKKDSQDTKNYHFCSWRCLLKCIPKIKSNYFASMPFLYFDRGKKDRSAKELFSIIKKLKF